MEEENLKSFKEALDNYDDLEWVQTLKFLTNISSFDEIEEEIDVSEFVHLMFFLYKIGQRQALSIETIQKTLSQETIDQLNQMATQVLTALAQKEQTKQVEDLSSFKTRTTPTGTILQRIK